MSTAQHYSQPTISSNPIVLNGFPEIIGAREFGHWEQKENGAMMLFVPGSS